MTSTASLSAHRARSSAPAPHVVAVTSGKGGVGKSSLSVNLGIALSRMGRKVCIFDADTGFANVNILLGLVPEYGLEHVLYGNKTLSDIMLDAGHGLKIIPGANSLAGGSSLPPRQQLHLCRELSRVEKQFDYLLVDTAAGLDENTLDFIRASRQTLLVITTEPTSLTDAFSLVRMLVRRGRKKHFHVVVNMCSNARQAKEVYMRFATAVEKYIGIKVAYLGCVMQDESLRTAVATQSPVALLDRNDPSSQLFFRLGAALEQAVPGVTQGGGFGAYWYRLYRHRSEEKAESSDDVRRQVVERSSPVLDGRRSLLDLQQRLLELMAERELPAADFSRMLETLGRAMQQHYGGVSEGKVLEAATEMAANTEMASIHSFDKARFGSQSALLQRLRANRDLPLLDVIGD